MTSLTGFHCRLLVSIYHPWLGMLVFEKRAMFKIITQRTLGRLPNLGTISPAVMPLHLKHMYSILILLFLSLNSWGQKTWGQDRRRILSRTYSRILIWVLFFVFVFAIQDQVNTCVLMQWSNQNLTRFLQGKSPKGISRGYPSHQILQQKII